MSEPMYIKIYHKSADSLMSLTTNQLSLLFCLVSRYENIDNMCQVVLDNEQKERICTVLGWSDSTFSNALRGLKKANIIIKTDKNRYRLNANIFGAKGGKHK